jgi:hypothetical protein
MVITDDELLLPLAIFAGWVHDNIIGRISLKSASMCVSVRKVQLAILFTA